MLLLAETIRLNKPVVVPPPMIFNGNNYHSIEDFFYFFERFCSVKYGDDQVSWLQVLPDFLCGEIKCIVDSFGRSKEVAYQTVKLRLIKEGNIRDFNEDCYSRFLKTERKEGESLRCFSIRLESLAGGIPNMSSSTTEALIRVRLLKTLSADLVDKLNVQLGHLDGVSNETLVIVASILESQLGNSTSPKMVACNNVSLPVFIKPKARRIKCFRCGMLGHIRRNCVVVLNKRQPPGKLLSHYDGKIVSKEGSNGNSHKKPVEATLATSRQMNWKRSNKSFPAGKRVHRKYELGSGMYNFDSGNDWNNQMRSSHSGGKNNFVPNHNLIKCPEHPKTSKLRSDPVVKKPIFTHPKDDCFPDCNEPMHNICLPDKLSDPSPIPRATSKVHVTNPSDHDLHNNLDWDVGSAEDLHESEEVSLDDSFSSSLNLDEIFNFENVHLHDEDESGYSSDSRISVSCSERKMEGDIPAFSDGFDCSLLSFRNISFCEFPLREYS